jgi:hypothetical protein
MYSSLSKEEKVKTKFKFKDVGNRIKKVGQDLKIANDKNKTNEKTSSNFSEFYEVFNWWKIANSFLPYPFPIEWDSNSKEMVALSKSKSKHVHLFPWYVNIFGIQLGLGGFSLIYLILRRVNFPTVPAFMETISFTHLIIFGALMMACFAQISIALALMIHSKDICCAINQLIQHNESLRDREYMEILQNYIKT